MAKTFTPAEHLEDVLSRYDESPDDRLAEISKAAIRHLHAFVQEVGLTRDEWMAGIEGLTKTGQMCTEERQEFILLSDTLGVSMLVEMVNHVAPEGCTEPTVFGPFHQEGAPEREMGDSVVEQDMSGGEGVEEVVFTGTVRSLGGEPVAGAKLDVWSTAANGLYDVQDAEQVGLNMRGIFTTGDDGRYEIRSVRPVGYQIPGDGPAGELLFANGRHNWRPAHMHFVVSAAGHRQVITHLFDAAADHLDSDAVFGVRDSLIADMSDGRCEYDFVLEQTS